MEHHTLHRSEGRVALVTGGGSGIGRQICVSLAAAGHNVGVADINTGGATETVAQIENAGGAAIAVAMDVTNSDSVVEGRLQVVDELGPIGVLVNCAGWDQLMPFIDTDEAFWDKVIEINYKGMLRTAHACLPDMIEVGWGRVINIASDAARVGSSLEAVYAGAKGGVISFTKTIAREVARKGVTANVVCPGPTDTPLIQAIVDDSDDGDKVIGAMTRAVPMKRMGQPSEIASAVVYFASEDAAFVTGQTLSVSGGLTMA
ncbi:MAG: SDR family oxidoreductase [Acidimicrobiales bacterium]|nr:SDR family oxidoreductase [Acidimicrobiales bacterium]RZV46233.1 MAG: SDR family oxidoreductase [Acidimicrobiales bacterium]